MRFLPGLVAICFWSGTTLSAQSENVVSARYTEPTTRYTHAILGDAIEWGALELVVEGCGDCQGNQTQTLTLRLPESRVFEDVAPRLVDVDGDGSTEVIVVETDVNRGARLAIFSGDGSLYAATPFIGRTRRWLAPIGAADLDGDGLLEVAYVDRPHLARLLRVWRVVDRELVEIASYEGVTNHRIGEADIGGGLRDCGDGIEMVVARADWSRLVAVRFDDGELVGRDIGIHRDRSSFAAALACEG